MKQPIASALILMSVLGCGGGGDGGADAPGADATSADASPADAAAATVTVHVVGPTGASADGIQVIFGDADGTLVADVTTDGLGVATAVMDPGGTVTVFDGSSAYTVTELPRGATLEVPLYPETPASVDRTVSWPAASSGLEVYAPHASCLVFTNQVSTLSAVITQRGECAGGYDLIIVAKDQEGLLAPSALVARDLAFSGAPAALPGPWKTMVGLGGQLLHRPTNANSTVVAIATPLLGARAIEAITFAQVTDDTYALAVPQDIDGFEVSASLYHPDMNHHGQLVTRVFAPGATATDLELDGLALRWPLDGSLALVDGDTALRWTDEAPGGDAAIDAHVALITLIAINGPDSYMWQIARSGTALVRAGDEVLVPIPDVPGDQPFERPATLQDPRINLYRYAGPDLDALRLDAFAQWLRGGRPIGHGVTGWSLTNVD